MKLPLNRVLNIFPPCIATAIAIKNPIVAKSPNGNTLFPGTIAAIRRVIGINNNPAAIT